LDDATRDISARRARLNDDFARQASDAVTSDTEPADDIIPDKYCRFAGVFISFIYFL